MATKYLSKFLKSNLVVTFASGQSNGRLLHTSQALFSVQSGKVKVSHKRNKPVTYEDSFSPPHIAHRKSWNSWNTSTIEHGLRPSETATEDLFIRQFMRGTFLGFILSKVIIKRQYNIIRISAVINTKGKPQALYFLVGYSETLLSHWLHCNVKIDFQAVNDPKMMIFNVEYLKKCTEEDDSLST